MLVALTVYLTIAVLIAVALDEFPWRARLMCGLGWLPCMLFALALITFDYIQDRL